MSANIWEYLFKNERLALRLPEVLNASDGLQIQSDVWGLVNVTAHIATALGDNFTSDAYAVKVTEENGTIHEAFVKVLPRLPALFGGAMTQGLYQREIAIYNCLHTQLRELREEAGACQSSVALDVPLLYYSIMDEEGPCGANRTAVVLQDMKTSGFRMVDKRFGTNAKEALLVMRALARYHALTIALVENKWRTPDGKIVPPANLEFTQRSIEFHEKNYDMIGVSIDVWVRMARERLGSEVADWLENEYKSNAQKAMKPESADTCEPLLCILHTDCWSNNLMFRYDENGEATDVCIVDWQITRLGHPATDVVHFLFSSTTTETRRGQLSYFLDEYYSCLASSLQSLGCKILEEHRYDKEKFLKDVHKRLRFGLFMSFIVLPAILDDSLFKAIALSRSKTTAEGAEETETPVKPFDVEEIKKYLPVENMLRNELLYSRIVNTTGEVKSLIEKNTFSH